MGYKPIPSDSLWAYRDELGGVPTFFVYIDTALPSLEGLVRHTVFMSTAVDDEAVSKVTPLRIDAFWRLVDAGTLERVDDPQVAIKRRFAHPRSCG